MRSLDGASGAPSDIVSICRSSAYGGGVTGGQTTSRLTGAVGPAIVHTLLVNPALHGPDIWNSDPQGVLLGIVPLTVTRSEAELPFGRLVIDQAIVLFVTVPDVDTVPMVGTAET